MAFARAGLLIASLVAAVSAEDIGAVEEPTALALPADDACLAAGEHEGCAVTALQRRSAKAVRAAGQLEQDIVAAVNALRMDDPHFVTGCTPATGGNSCPSGLTCVAKADDTWSQCLDCSAEGFQRDCSMMNEDMRQAATAACQRTCHSPTPAPIISGCNSNATGQECADHLTCVTTADGTYSQCVDCSRQFYQDCQKMEDNMRLASIKACHRTCQDTRCMSNEWCMHPYECIDSGTWAQCVACNSHRTFRYTCHDWEAAYRTAVEHRCHHRCTTH